MYSRKTIEEVRILRASGKTYREIQVKLRKKIPKGTLNSWCKKIPLPSFYKYRIRKINLANLKKARILALQRNKKNRLELIEKLKTKNTYLLNKIDISTQKLLLSILYLAEGAKHSSIRALALGNSDPNIVSFYLKLLGNCYDLSPGKFRARIQCRADQNPEKLEYFWSKLTRIPRSQFYPTYKDRRTIGKPTKKPGYQGVCVITYFDTRIHLELELLAESVLKYLNSGHGYV